MCWFSREMPRPVARNLLLGGKLDPWGAGIWVNDVKFFDDLFSELPQVQLGGKLGQLGGKAPLPPWLRA
jgi:hypothetical protein